MLGADVEVFEIDAGVATPGGVVVEVKSEADGDSRAGFVPLGDEAVEAFGGAEAVAQKIGFGGVNGVGFALVRSEFADEGEDLRNVSGCGGAEIGACCPCCDRLVFAGAGVAGLPLLAECGGRLDYGGHCGFFRRGDEA